MASRPVSPRVPVPVVDLTKPKAKANYECDICTETCNNSNHKHAQCSKCESHVCRECIRTYLLGSVQDPCCPHCKHSWEMDFLNNLCGSTWIFNQHRHHRQTLLMDREKAKIPGDMEAIQMYKGYIDRQREALKFAAEVEEKRQAWLDAQTTREQMFRDADRLRLAALGQKPKKKDEWKFIQPCPGTDCSGYLSTVGKCPVCEIWTCMQCFEQKGPSKDSAHTCKEDDVASAQHIKKHTKRCPECGVPCVRVSGCTQMWCPQCHASFSYRTGEVYRNAVHNPERSMWIVNGKSAPSRKRKSSSSSSVGVTAEGHCPNGLVEFGTYNHNVILRRGTYIQQGKRHIVDSYTLRSLYSGVADLERYQLPRLRLRVNQEGDSKFMRIRYALKDVQEDTMKKKLEQDDRKKRHWTHILNIMTLVYEVMQDTINHMAQEATYESLRDGLKQHDAIVQHARTRLKAIHKMTKLQTPTIQQYSLLQHSYY